MKENIINELDLVFQTNADHVIAQQQENYLKNNFKCFGIKAVKRRELTKPFLDRAYLPSKNTAFDLTLSLWQKPEREYHQFGIDLLNKYVKKLDVEDIQKLEYLIINQSWWDTVDMISTSIVGAYFMKFPKEREIILQAWLDSDNIWLQRTTLLYQLKYKDKLDTEILTHCINSLLGSKEFFINKAIGWILRQYSRTNAEWVIDFVEKTLLLAPLSKKEALRLIPYSI